MNPSLTLILLSQGVKLVWPHDWGEHEALFCMVGWSLAPAMIVMNGVRSELRA